MLTSGSSQAKDFIFQEQCGKVLKSAKTGVHGLTKWEDTLASTGRRRKFYLLTDLRVQERALSEIGMLSKLLTETAFPFGGTMVSKHGLIFFEFRFPNLPSLSEAMKKSEQALLCDFFIFAMILHVSFCGKWIFLFVWDYMDLPFIFSEGREKIYGYYLLASKSPRHERGR